MLLIDFLRFSRFCSVFCLFLADSAVLPEFIERGGLLASTAMETHNQWAVLMEDSVDKTVCNDVSEKGGVSLGNYDANLSVNKSVLQDISCSLPDNQMEYNQ